MHEASSLISFLMLRELWAEPVSTEHARATTADIGATRVRIERAEHQAIGLVLPVQLRTDPPTQVGRRSVSPNRAAPISFIVCVIIVIDAFSGYIGFTMLAALVGAWPWFIEPRLTDADFERLLRG